jgi:tetratricopeptide (TPR) repeat protein/O-antigen ligase
MVTKINRLSANMMEAAWLMAVILVPLYFNIYSSRIFEPDKIAILRSLALVACGAWVVKVLDMRVNRNNLPHSESVSSINIWQVPLVLPAVAVAVLYLVSTAFSVNPAISLLGSYQRLQGAYTTLSYLVIFFVILFNLRKKEQLDRLITVIVLTSLPIVFYGVLQRFKLDPIPWGGDTTVRIAANMGNSIFIAAYLIMVFPLTMMRTVQAFGAILSGDALVLQVVRASLYVFISAMQVIALYLSGSRGPALGWLAGTFIMFLLLSIIWKKRTLTMTILAVSGSAAIFLLVFNVPNSPLRALRGSPAIGRFGSLLDAESNSALVRKYIWQGAARLVSLHPPLEYPDGTADRFNFLRPLIGYGPESMYVAYNPFYIPALAQVERRNASPDRSHNETWDALVITGVVGIVVYLTLFIACFYYGLKWLGLISHTGMRNLFLFLLIGVGLIGAIALSAWRGIEYFGVGLPFGMLIGLLIYLVIAALRNFYQLNSQPDQNWRQLLLIGLIAAVTAHFVEINFGIAIAVTRLYFWVFAALMVVVGHPILAGAGKLGESSDGQSEISGRESLKLPGANIIRKRRLTKITRQPVVRFTWKIDKTALLNACVTAVFLLTFGYLYFTNPRALSSSVGLIWSAMTRLPSNGTATSPGILMLIGLSWIIISTILSIESLRSPQSGYLKSYVITLLTSFAIAMFFWLLHAGALASFVRVNATTLEEVLIQVGRYAGLISNFYIFHGLLLFGLTWLLYSPEEQNQRSAPASIFSIPIVALVVVVLIVTSNLRIIQADIAFKLAEPFTRAGQWPVAISIYERANQLALREDYYYLFLGRGYLEFARSISDPLERDGWIRKAEIDLKQAAKINPLNTDHTANLARLYSLWAGTTQDSQIKLERGELASEYFSKAVRLSPNNARLWNEWSLLMMNILQDPTMALELLEKAKQIDPLYHWTYALFGELKMREARAQSDTVIKGNLLAQAIEYYQKALSLPATGEPAAPYNYALALGNAYFEMGNLREAIISYQQALLAAPIGTETWRLEIEIANLYIKIGDKAEALSHLELALGNAPDDQKARIQGLFQQLQQVAP